MPNTERTERLDRTEKQEELQTTKTSIYPDEELLERIKSYAANLQMSVNKLSVILLSKGMDNLEKTGIGYLFGKQL